MNVQQIVAVDDVAKQIHKNAREHGFYEQAEAIMDFLAVNDQPQHRAGIVMNFTLAQLAKIASEVGEAVEVIQKDRGAEDFGEELADIIIRTLDLAVWCEIPIAKQIHDKMKKNALRPYLHGGRC